MVRTPRVFLAGMGLLWLLGLTACNESEESCSGLGCVCETPLDCDVGLSCSLEIQRCVDPNWTPSGEDVDTSDASQSDGEVPSDVEDVDGTSDGGGSLPEWDEDVDGYADAVEIEQEGLCESLCASVGECTEGGEPDCVGSCESVYAALSGVVETSESSSACAMQMRNAVDCVGREELSCGQASACLDPLKDNCDCFEMVRSDSAGCQHRYSEEMPELCMAECVFRNMDCIADQDALEVERACEEQCEGLVAGTQELLAAASDVPFCTERVMSFWTCTAGIQNCQENAACALLVNPALAPDATTCSEDSECDGGKVCSDGYCLNMALAELCPCRELLQDEQLAQLCF